MLMEMEDEIRDFVTIYRKDFLEKKIDRRKEYRPKPEYPPPLNILNGPYKMYLNKICPRTVPVEDLIEEKERELMQTVYHMDYSKGDYSPRVKIYGRQKDISLPDDWIISESIHRKSYRNPWKIATKNLLRAVKDVTPPDNLIPNEKEREILRIRTGDSEYDATIDATGNKIIEECLLGAPLPIEPNIYVKGPDSPQSECSQILAQKKITLPSNVL